MSLKKIHYYTLHYNGVRAGDFFTNQKGLVTCPYCLRQIKKAAQPARAVDVAKPTTKQHNPMYEWSPNMDTDSEIAA